MCLPDVENPTFPIPTFCLISHPSVYRFQKKNTQFWPNWALFTIICPKFTQFMNLGSFVSDEPPPQRYTKFREKVPQKSGTYIRTPCQCENPRHQIAQIEFRNAKFLYARGRCPLQPPPEGCVPWTPARGPPGTSVVSQQLAPPPFQRLDPPLKKARWIYGKKRKTGRKISI